MNKILLFLTLSSVALIAEAHKESALKAKDKINIEPQNTPSDAVSYTHLTLPTTERV